MTEKEKIILGNEIVKKVVDSLPKEGVNEVAIVITFEDGIVLHLAGVVINEEEAQETIN